MLVHAGSGGPPGSGVGEAPAEGELLEGVSSWICPSIPLLQPPSGHFTPVTVKSEILPNDYSNCERAWNADAFGCKILYYAYCACKRGYRHWKKRCQLHLTG